MFETNVIGGSCCTSNFVKYASRKFPELANRFKIEQDEKDDSVFEVYLDDNGVSCPDLELFTAYLQGWHDYAAHEMEP